jgi:hypothetical protein
VILLGASCAMPVHRDGQYRAPHRDIREIGAVRSRSLVAQFGAPEQAEFPRRQRRTTESLVATFATKAGLLVMPGQEQEVTLGRIRAFLASRPETARGEFPLPMLTGVPRVRRL